MERHPRPWPLERHRLRVQERTLQPVALEFGIALAIAVLVVAEQRMSGKRSMNPDLMRPARGDVHFHQRRQRTEKLHRLEDAHRVLAGRRHSHVAFAVLAIVGRQRRIDPFGAQLPAAGYQGQIGLVNAAAADQRMQRDQGRPVACNEQTAAGVAIQPMDQFERLARPRRAQLIPLPPWTATPAGLSITNTCLS